MPQYNKHDPQPTKEQLERWTTPKVEPPTIEVRGRCGDCAVEPGATHIDGCDIARCTACGMQRIGCGHGSSNTGWGQLWTGIWPGCIEVAMYGLDSLNDVMPGATWDRKNQLWLRK